LEGKLGSRSGLSNGKPKWAWKWEAEAGFEREAGKPKRALKGKLGSRSGL